MLENLRTLKLMLASRTIFVVALTSKLHPSPSERPIKGLGLKLNTREGIEPYRKAFEANIS
jgi:hypothetical protein